MSAAELAGRRADAAGPLGFLAVDRYLGSIVEARSLRTAFDIGLIDHLLQRGSAPLHLLGPATGCDRRGLEMLLGLLVAGGVLEELQGDVRLHPDFVATMRWRDLLETKLDFAGLLLDDFADHFTALVQDPARFVERGRLFDLFDYQRALVDTADNDRRTRAWMRLTSTLTRYEARACETLLDFSRHRALLDVGGNSGEFALQVCRRHPALRATVFDLPLVCRIGMEHLLPHPEASRIGFVAGDLRTDPLPAGHDVVGFKSVLHDWPPEDVERFLQSAAQALAPGGTLYVFERAPLRPAVRLPRLGDLPVLLFFRSYREPDLYAQAFGRLGLVDVRVRTVSLDTEFFLVEGTKP